jgi:hypothetical protein
MGGEKSRSLSGIVVRYEAYVEDFFRAENDADGHGLFAAIEWSMLDRLLVKDKISRRG